MKCVAVARESVVAEMWLAQAIQNANRELRSLDEQTKEFNRQYRRRIHRLPAHIEESYLSMIDRKVRLRSWLEKATVMSGASSQIKSRGHLAPLFFLKRGAAALAAA
ncbi:MAG: hypothetical protein HYU64_20880 [Armatimonadetes bacterium]|nr:hypothetical protein [Armatimonadota bacterium]